MPLAIAKDDHNPEKLPGPWFTKIWPKSFNFILFSAKKSIICLAIRSFKNLSLCKILLNVLF